MIDLGLFGDVLRSEWTKLRSVRSTYWTVLASIALGVGLGCAISAGNASSYHSMSLADRLTFDPVALSTAGLFFAQLSLGVLAILAMSAEYSSGTIRTTVAAVPQRGYVLVAKALLVAVLSLAIALAIAFGTFAICESIFSHYGLHVTLSRPGATRAIVGAGLYIGVLALFAMGLAAIIRHTAGAITALVAIVFIVPIVSNLLPDAWQQNFARYLPANAGGSITQTIQTTGSLSPWRGFIVFVLWGIASLAAGWLLLRTRDV